MYKAPELTGRMRHRTSWLGTWVMEIEETVSYIAAIRPQPGVDRWRQKTRWRDAKIQDYLAMTIAGIPLTDIRERKALSADIIAQLRRDFLDMQ